MKKFLCTILILLSFTSIICIPNISPASGSTNLRFGINYYATNNHYEQYRLTDEILDRDFSLFKNQGFKYIILETIWKYHEPTEGTYNDGAISDLIRVCNFAAKYNLNVIIDFHTRIPATGYWTMPDWIENQTNQIFETVFLNETVKQAWLNYLGYVANGLKDVPNLESWQMMNEPYRDTWGCNVSIQDYIDLWTEMKNVFRTYSTKPVSIRFDEYLEYHFNFDPRICNICDYISLNWYFQEDDSSELASAVSYAKQNGCEVMISEFGSKSTDDALANEEYLSSLNLFRELGVADCAAFFWRADFNSTSPDPPGKGYNLAKDVNGTPRPAFYNLINSIQEPIPTPTITPSPTPTATPSPTPTEPEQTPTPTEDPTVTSTPCPTTPEFPTITIIICMLIVCSNIILISKRKFIRV